MISSYDLDHGEKLHLMFFTEVQNVSEIVKKFSSNCTVINSKLILDSFQILVAANKAVVAKFNNALITNNLCTELLFNLSISDNITESLHKFGYGSNTNDLLIAVFGSDTQQLQSIISETQGNLDRISTLKEKCDLDLIRQTYDITSELDSISHLLDLIITKIACKSI